MIGKIFGNLNEFFKFFYCWKWKYENPKYFSFLHKKENYFGLLRIYQTNEPIQKIWKMSKKKESFHPYKYPANRV